MPKINSSNEHVPQMSEEMKSSITKAVAKFGFDPRQYEKFLESVWAMRNGSVIEFPNSQIEKYRAKFISPHEHGLNDTLMFDEYSKIKFKEENKGYKESGYFCPRQFWDFAIKIH